MKPWLKLISSFFEKDKRFSSKLLVTLGLGFLLLTIFVYLLPHSFLDLEFSEEMQEHQNPVLDALMKGISWFGTPMIALAMVLLAALLFAVFSYRREGFFTASTLLAAGATQILKTIINRPRPTADLVQIIEVAKYQSFPSGHTALYVTFFGFLTFLMLHLSKLPNSLRWPVIGCSLFLIFTIPFSRVYLGAHWFTDVAGGFLVGLLCLAGIIQGYLKSGKKVI